MFEITKFNEVNVSGRGKIFTVHMDDHPEMENCKAGDTILAMNKQWTVTGVEIFMKLMHPPFPGKNRGYIVKEKK